jgi:ribosomal protein L13E
MAVATARRVRADRAVKERILQAFGHNSASVVRKMSYQLPTQPTNSAEQQLMNSPNQGDGFSVPAGRETGLKKRKAAKGKVPADLRRSASTPHLRGPPTGDSGPLSPNSDKRRNKLGYHRTSVACGKFSMRPRLQLDTL